MTDEIITLTPKMSFEVVIGERRPHIDRPEQQHIGETSQEVGFGSRRASWRVVARSGSESVEGPNFGRFGVPSVVGASR
jgi:hypothetical protein